MAAKQPERPAQNSLPPNSVPHICAQKPPGEGRQSSIPGFATNTGTPAASTGSRANVKAGVERRTGEEL
jgi:hypothetical protein